MFSKAIIAAVAAFLPLISAHVVMVDPAPYSNATDNSPLAADGSNFPCKLTTGSTASDRTYMPGVADTFKLMGSAVHGGGSCQISVTYDNPPTASSVFKVVQSFEGACPISTSGNLAEPASYALPDLPVTFPTGLKAGDAVFVWTWFNKVGNREMYMNCAPITIGGSETSDTVFNALPDMFVANIETPSSSCTTKETFDIVFPNPGSNLVVAPASDSVNYAPACGTGTADPSGSAPVASVSSAAAPTGTPALVGGGQVITSTPTVGTVFTPIAASPTTMATVVVSSSAAVVPTPVASTPATSGSSSSTSSLAVGSACSTEGLMCVAGEPYTWAECTSGAISQSGGAVPGGTWCNPAINDFDYTSTMNETKPAKLRYARRNRPHMVKKSHRHFA